MDRQDQSSWLYYFVSVVLMIWLTSLIVIYGFIQSDMLCMLFRS